MISAGVAIAVARACSSGIISECGCERVPKGAAGGPRWKWAGCSHNARYGVKFARTFLDVAESQAEDIRSRVNLHNNQVGRMAVTSNMQIKCKCHGMSGSCELKTCWRATPDYRTVGRALKEKYNVAVLVDQNNLGKQWTPRRTKHKRDLSRDLLYYQKSPDFCEKEKSLDLPGTRGRRCNRTAIASAPDSCSALCCGRGYDLVSKKIVSNFKIQFTQGSYTLNNLK
ncbi:unnamed protein product [Acanthoscelides obtectus]|uniref:Protein Wnt n=1 Tax=Acanthoscelides obtectus TaxID=200917 RepID=A0A9P0KM10_ACAOB|nr:unnamed protein product [Acanthoscelides obtectus]CAK1662901.1 Protein Wnt-4 [Acanthoscelides obtectus]